MRELLELEAQNELARCAIHREVVHYRADALTCDSEMALPSETPVALVYNGIAHSVMMCSASDLEDFAIGFSLSEGIIDSLLDIHDIEQIDGCQGLSCISPWPIAASIASKRSGAPWRAVPVAASAAARVWSR